MSSPYVSLARKALWPISVPSGIQIFTSCGCVPPSWSRYTWKRRRIATVPGLSDTAAPTSFSSGADSRICAHGFRSIEEPRCTTTHRHVRERTEHDARGQARDAFTC
jgi:hypothetical protein